MKYVLLTAAILAVMLVCSCEHSEDLIQPIDTSDMTVQLTETSTDTTVPYSDINDTSATSFEYEITSTNKDVNLVTRTLFDDTQEETETYDDSHSENVYLNPNGWEFASDFDMGTAGSVILDESIIKYWNTGNNIVKFELGPYDNENIFKINDNVVDLGWYMNIFQILVTDDYVVVITGLTDTCTYKIYIFDYSGNTLFKTYYLSNTGMILEGQVEISENKIILPGTRIRTYNYLTIGLDSGSFDEFSEYSDYLYEDIVYTYEDIPYGITIAKFNADKLYLMNQNEIVSGTFEIEYLGGGKFSKIKLTDKYRTLEETIKIYFAEEEKWEMET